MNRLLALAILILSSAGGSKLAFGQSLGNAGTIQGAVPYPSGAAVPQATVTLVNRISGYQQAATTDSKGTFRLNNIPTNPYHLEVTASGFANSEQDVDIRSSVPVELKVQLGLAGAQTTVNVEAAGADILENDP